jgi:hypothetical protein
MDSGVRVQAKSDPVRFLEENTREGQEVEKEHEDEKAKKEQRTSNSRRRRWRSRQEAREQQGAAA